MQISNVSTLTSLHFQKPLQENTTRFSQQIPKIATKIQSMNLKPPVLLGVGLLALISLPLVQAGAGEFRECFTRCMSGGDPSFWRGVGCTAQCGALLLF